MVGQTISHYRILREIASGGMGVVYEAEDVLLHLPVAIKVIRQREDADAEERFLREAHAIASLDHPNICSFREIDRTDEGQLFLVMAYCNGGSLRDRLKRGRLSPTEALDLADSVLSGLACAHDAGVIHRDIKPANLVYSDRYLKIVDFGLARLQGRSRRTQRGMSPGTIAYMSPEQLDGREVDARTDLWSFGVVLYQALTGRHPFAADRSDAIGYRILNDTHTPACEVDPAVPRELSDLVDRCLAKDPAARFGSAAEAQTARSRMDLDTGGTDSQAITEPLHSARAHRRRSLAWILPVAAFVAAAVAIVWILSRPENVYVTETRLAVLPFENRLGDPGERVFLAGVTDIASEVLGGLAREQRSAWVVPHAYVRAAGVTSADGADAAFGVNRVVQGRLERYGDGLRLEIRSTDPRSGQTHRARRIDFAEGDATTLLDALPGSLAGVAGFPESDLAVIERPDGAVRAYVEGRGLLVHSDIGPDPHAARARFESVVATDSSFAPARARAAMALWYLYQGSGDEDAGRRARAHLATAASGSRSLDTRALAGNVWLRLGETERAIHELEPVVAEDSAHVEAVRDLARAYVTAGRFDEAEGLLARATERLPDCFVLYREAGTNHFRIGEYEPAIRWLRDAVTYAPEDGFSLNVLAGAYYHMEDLESARRYWERAFAVWPNCDSANNVGLLQYRRGDYLESARYYEFALGYCDSTDADVWGNLGRVLWLVEGRHEDSMQALRRAVALSKVRLSQSPGDSDLLLALAEYRALLGDDGEARRLLATVDSLGDGRADTAYETAVTFETIGERDEALKRLATALERGFPLERVETNPWLAELRKDERFLALIPADAR